MFVEGKSFWLFLKKLILMLRTSNTLRKRDVIYFFIERYSSLLKQSLGFLWRNFKWNCRPCQKKKFEEVWEKNGGLCFLTRTASTKLFGSEHNNILSHKRQKLTEGNVKKFVFCDCNVFRWLKDIDFSESHYRYQYQ